MLELILLALNGFNFNTGTLINGIGALQVLFFSILAVASYFKEMEHNSFENAIAFVYAAFLFAYGGVTILYVLNYFKISTLKDPNEFFLVLCRIALVGPINQLWFVALCIQTGSCQKQKIRFQVSLPYFFFA